MGKALKTVGVIIGAAALIATGVGALAMPALAGTTTLFGVSVGTLNTISSGLVAVGGMLDKPKSQGSASPDEWTSNPDQPIPFLMGRMGVAGKIVQRDEFGPDNMYQGIVGILSGAGPIRAVTSFAGDKQPVSFGANGIAVSSQWQGEMWMVRRSGAQPDTVLTVPAGLKTGGSAFEWSSAAKLSGKACYLQVLGENSKGTAFPAGIPDPVHVAEGIFGYDPRYDDTYPGGAGPCRLGVRSTYRWIEDGGIGALNWALGLVENGQVVGGIGASIDGIDVPAFVEVANIADANGWKLAAWPDTSEDVSAVLDQLLQAAGAVRARHAGKISCVSRGAPRASVATITARDTAGDIELDTAPSLFNRLNTITPRFMSEAAGWVLTPANPVAFAQYVTDDGGKHGDQIDYRFVPLLKQAAELAAYDILDAREPFSGTIPLKAHMRHLKRGDTFDIDEPGFLMDGVKCIVLSRSYDPKTAQVRIGFRSETDSKHALALGKTTTLPDFPTLTPTDPTIVSPPLPEDWVIVVRPPATDGTQLPGFDLTGVVSNATADAMLISWRAVAEGEDPDVQPLFADEDGAILPGWTDAGVYPPTTRTLTIQGPQSGDVIWIAIRYKRGNNYSDAILTGPLTAGTLAAGVVIDTTPPADVAGLTLSSTSTPDAAGNPYVRIIATWTANTDEDLNGYEVEITEAGVTVVDYVATNQHSREALTGRTYTFRVRAIDKAGNRSAWTAPQDIVGAGDTTPPGPPTTLTVAVSLGSFFLEWTNPTVSDLSKIEVWEHTSNASGSATRIATVNAQSGAKGSYSRSGMTSGAVRYFWLKAVDTSGNASVFSAVASGTIPSVPAGEIDTTPPGVPSGLSLSTALVTDAGTGLPRPRVVATWTAPGDADLAGFDVEVTESGGNPVTRMVSTNRDQWNARPNVSYSVRVRAFDRVGNRSAWTATQSITAPADAAAPAAPTALNAIASVGSIFLSGVAPSDSDTAKIEIWENTTNNSGTATRIAVVNAIPGLAWAHPRTGLVANDTRWFWAKAVDTSGNASAFSVGISRTVPYVATPDIAVGTLAGDRLLANSVEGSVLKTNTSLPGSVTVGDTGVTIETIRGQADDPAARVNVNTTKITPGMIQVSGATTLADWRMGGDETRINGGAVAANTIAANKLTIGNRGVTFDRLNFSATDGVLTWSNGRVTYIADSGAATAFDVAGGSHTYSASGGDATYIYWVQGAAGLSVTKSATTATANAVIVGAFYGGNNFTEAHGRTIIDGSGIKTNSIDTLQLRSGSVVTDILAANSVTGEKVQANTFDGSVFKTNTSLPGTITVGSTGVSIATIQSQANDPAARVNANSTLITPGRIQLAGASTLASWQHGGDATQINGGSIATNTIAANKVSIGNRGVTFDRFSFSTSGNTLTWGNGRVTYIADSGAATAFDISGGSHTYSASGGDVTYLYWTQGSTTLATTKSSTVATSNAVLIGAYYGGSLFTANYGRTIIDGDYIKTGAIDATKINVTDLSAITANIGNMTAGKVGNAAGTTFFDLTNGRQQFQVGAYVWRQGAIGSSVVTWFGPSSIPIGSETRTNGAFATGTDGIPYLGTAPLENGSGGDLTVDSNIGQTKGGSGYNMIAGSGWQTLSSVTLTGVTAGEMILASQEWGLPTTSGGTFNGEVRLVDGATVVAGPEPLIVGNMSAVDPVYFNGFAVASGSRTYTLQARQISGAVLNGGSGAYSYARMASATSSSAGLMSPTQASQLAALVAGGGGGGVTLATTAPPAIGSAAVGTGTTAARDDHTHAPAFPLSNNNAYTIGATSPGVANQASRSDHSHAHGNQGGGSQHALAVSGGAAGFLSGTGAYYLGNVTAANTANSLVWRDAGANSSFNSVYGAGAFYAPAFTVTSDEKTKKNIVDFEDALSLVMGLRPRRYEKRKTGDKAFGFVAQEIDAILPESVWVKPDGELSVEYGTIVAVLAGAIQELAMQVHDLQSRIDQPQGAPS